MGCKIRPVIKNKKILTFDTTTEAALMLFDKEEYEHQGIASVTLPTYAYRYGFNGQKRESTVNDGVYSAEYWFYDGRLGRRWNVDPVDQVSMSNYSVLGNNPIMFIDPKGDNWYQDDKGKIVYQMGEDSEIDYSTYDNEGNVLKTHTYKSIGTELIYLKKSEGSDSYNMVVHVREHKIENGNGYSLQSNEYSINTKEGFEIISKDIQKNSAPGFEAYLSILNADYFFNAAKNYYQDNSSGWLSTYLNYDKASKDGILISQWTHDLIADGSEEKNAVEHYIGTMLMNQRYGWTRTTYVTTMNEIRGLIINDEQSGNVSNALEGKGGTAFEWKDLWNNLNGAFFSNGILRNSGQYKQMNSRLRNGEQ